MSLPPIRDALKMLETLGFIEIRPRKKVVVKSIAVNVITDPLIYLLRGNLDMVLQLLEVRKILEAWAASKASQFATKKDIARLQELYRELEDDFNKDRLGVDADSRFHFTLYQAAGNTILSHIVCSLFDLLWQSQKVIRETMYNQDQNKEALLQQHRKILKAIMERNPKKARSAILEHLNFAAKKILEISSTK